MWPSAVTALLDHLLAEQKAILGPNLVGLYLRGSLALGDFAPETSDVDVCCIMDQAISSTEFAALAALHACMFASGQPYSHDLEVAYLPRASAEYWRPEERHPTLSRGGGVLDWHTHHENWVLERWAMLHGRSRWFGPEPHTLIAPVSDAQLRRAVLHRLQDWRAFALTPGDPGWSHRGHAVYAAETLCRIAHTLSTGHLSSKPTAVRWAAATFPEPWHTLIISLENWRTDPAIDPDLNRQVQQLILWAAQQIDSKSLGAT
ncbi:nucleotidyltransferase domain-containing protein [Deinococcus aquatilis]|jgi:predicted nucleotidyltransferase|uniref:nucleotidyltransferase domain-containing protein n=1 Tax=Deinococcus aquatilis TaxID=519440 RepID=UPI000377E7E6|nr:nucleotidyltransferase domain-containing protein [Deinococcus aquatilis]